MKQITVIKKLLASGYKSSLKILRVHREKDVKNYKYRNIKLTIMTKIKLTIFFIPINLNGLKPFTKGVLGWFVK